MTAVWLSDGWLLKLICSVGFWGCRVVRGGILLNIDSLMLYSFEWIWIVMLFFFLTGWLYSLMRAFISTMSLFQSLWQLTSCCSQIFCISSNQLAHNVTNDFWVYFWVCLPLVDYWRSILVLFIWPIHFKLFIFTKDNMSRSLNVFYKSLFIFFPLNVIFFCCSIDHSKNHYFKTSQPFCYIRI